MSNTKKKTTESFKQEVYNLVGDEYTVLSKYINGITKILMKHNICNYEYEVCPKNFIRGTRCPQCFGTPKKTTEQFKQEVYDSVGDEYTVLGEYVNIKNKILMKHNICNYEYEVLPNSFLSNKNRCPKCAMVVKKTTESFKQEVYDLVGDEYTVLGEYVNTNTKILMKHNKCNYEYEVRPNDFINNSNRCPKCAYNIRGSKNRKSTRLFKQQICNLVGNEYTILGEYNGTNKHLLMKHNVCNKSYMVQPNHFLNGTRCPFCFGTHKRTTEQFKQEVYDLVGDEYTVLGEYLNTNTKILIKHNKCNYEYKTIPNNFLHSDMRCPKCSESKGEKRISTYLENSKINFVREKVFSDCKYKKSLRFDFYLPDYNTCIEFDGIQHFKESYFGPNSKSLENIQERDRVKNNYCKSNNIKLIRISYKDYNNVSKILDESLK